MIPRRAVAPKRAVAIVAVLAIVFTVAPISALEVRQTDLDSHYHAGLVRAYAPCLTPNTTAFGGEPACSPAVTSVCGDYFPAWVDIVGWDDFAPVVSLDTAPGVASASCDVADWDVLYALRLSHEDAEECPSHRCTRQDISVRFPLKYSFGPPFAGLLPLQPIGLTNGNLEVLGVTIVDGDGLPVAASGVGPLYGADPALDARIVSNLTVPYDRCPSGYCDITPWTSPCDFESGEIEWRRNDPGTGAFVHATLRDVTGSSPLCTTGTYHVAATVRSTVHGCGDPHHPTLCTLVDQAVSVPLQASGRKLDVGGVVNTSSGYDYFYHTIQVLESRLVDPTGTVVAASGVTAVQPAFSPSIAIKGTSLKLRADIDIRFSATNDPTAFIDPLLDDGVTVTLTDRDGPAYVVNIPPDLWQLQPPIGSRWDYNDVNGIRNGVRKARVKRLTKKGVVIGYRVDLLAKGADLSAADFPGLTVEIAVTRRTLLGAEGIFSVQSHRTCKGVPGHFTCK